MVRVNYLLVACAHRAHRDVDTVTKGRDVLRLHLEQLLKTDLEPLAQLTIVRPLPLERGPYSKEFWDVDDLISELRKRCRVEFLDVVDSWWSYSSWVQACQRYGTEFDYYILMEDDFYPVQSNFVEILVGIHRRKLLKGGYLCSYKFGGIGSLSNGMVDAVSFCAGIDRVEDPIKSLAPGAQELFSRLFFDNIEDFTDEYRCLSFGFSGPRLFELVTADSLNRPIKDQDLINPIQYVTEGYSP